MIGKDMTKMTLPVSFNEPTSLLQRVTEDMVCSFLSFFHPEVPYYPPVPAADQVPTPLTTFVQT